MRKPVQRVSSLFLALVLISLNWIPVNAWGAPAHHIIATIAERHLTPKAKQAIAEILGTEVSPAPGPVDHVTVPILVEGNRPFIDVTFERPNGSKRTARFLIDSGGGGFLMTESLALDVGLRLGKVSEEEGEKFATAEVPPKAYVGDFPLKLNPVAS